MGKSLGTIEVVGLSSAIVVADAMVKTANIEINDIEITKGFGFVTVKVFGDVGAVKAAISAGKSLALQSDAYVASNVIARPNADLEKRILSFREDEKKEEPKKEESKTANKKPENKKEVAKEEKTTVGENKVEKTESKKNDSEVKEDNKKIVEDVKEVKVEEKETKTEEKTEQIEIKEEVKETKPQQTSTRRKRTTNKVTNDNKNSK